MRARGALLHHHREVRPTRQEVERWRRLAHELDAEVHWDKREILSRSRVRPWKIDYLAPELIDPIQAQARVRTRLTAYGEPRSRPFAIYRDSLSPLLLPATRHTSLPGGLRWLLQAFRPRHLYSLSQFMVDVAPTWTEAAPRAAIVVTDHGAADWAIFEPDHVQLGWERGEPSLDQLRLAIATLQELTAAPRSPLPFR